jgi:hypothetical protein
VDRGGKGYESSTRTKVVTMSRFTFGFLLGAGAGWAVGSGKAAEWKRTLEDRRAFGGDTTRPAGADPFGGSVHGIAPEYGLPDDVSAR